MIPDAMIFSLFIVFSPAVRLWGDGSYIVVTHEILLLFFFLFFSLLFFSFYFFSFFEVDICDWLIKVAQKNLKYLAFDTLFLKAFFFFPFLWRHVANILCI